MANQKSKPQYHKFYKDIIDIGSAFKNDHQKNIAKIDDELIKIRLGEGKYLLEKEKIQINEEILTNLLDDYFPIFENYKSLFDFNINTLKEKMGKINITKLLKLVLSDNLEKLKEFGQESNINSDLLLFFGVNLSQVLFGAYAQELQAIIDHDNWLKKECPVCGSQPAMQKFKREDGSKILWCGLCGTQWRFKRLACSHCDNEDSATLRYFFVEEDSPVASDPFRVDVCDKCKKYIKTTDERNLPEQQQANFPINNVETLYLDIIAYRDGFESPIYWVNSSWKKEK